MFSNKKDIELFLKCMGIRDYIINGDLTVDVNNDVNLDDKVLELIPVQFGAVSGYFSCHSNKLTSLRGCPSIVLGDFYCFQNKLTSLEYSPKEVEGNYFCYQNRLVTLKGIPSIINRSFSCHNNQLTSLDHCPLEIGGFLECSNNKLTTFIGFPNVIEMDLFIEGNDFNIEDLCEFNCLVRGENIFSDFECYHEDYNKDNFMEKVKVQKVAREKELLNKIIMPDEVTANIKRRL